MTDKTTSSQRKEEKYLSYTFNDNIPQGYELFVCYHCKQKYLSQGDKDEELMFCPIHKNFDFCSSCEKTFDATTEDLQFNANGELQCKKCFTHYCIECGTELDNFERDDRFCSQDCSKLYWSDFGRDDEY